MGTDDETSPPSAAEAPTFADAVAALPWVRQLCPQMPHEYAVLAESPLWAWDVVDAMVSHRNPETYLAYFRGYSKPTRYWDAPDGLRYWRTRQLNRCRPDSVEPLRRVNEGARPLDGWQGPPFAARGAKIYERDAFGRWRPTATALESGYSQCRACVRVGA